MANDVRVDTTFVGLFLIGFVLLMFGVLGLQLGNVFGDVPKDMPIDTHVFAHVVGIIGVIIVLLAIFAYRTGAAVAAGVFAFVGAFFIIYYMDNDFCLVAGNSNWFLYIAIAIFFLIYAFYSFMQKAPKFLTILLVIVTFVVFFFGLALAFSPAGPCANVDAFKGLAITTGIFAFIGFVVATYLGLAFANPKKVPLI